MKSLNPLKTLTLAAAMLMPFATHAKTATLNTVAADLHKIPSQARPAGSVTQLATDEQGRGLVMLRSFKKGEVGAPHKPGNQAVRLAVVVSGVIYHGVGETLDPTKETAYHPGDVILMAASDMYWMAARDADASIMFTFVPPAQLNSALLEQMK